MGGFAGFAVVLLAGDFGVFEDGGVEGGGFFCLAVEPEAGCDGRRHIAVEFGVVKVEFLEEGEVM